MFYVSVVSLPLLLDIFRSHWYNSHKETRNSTKCKSFYFLSPGTARYHVNVFINLFLDYTQGLHYYWHSVTFKVFHFLDDYVQVIEFMYLIIIFDWYAIVVVIIIYLLIRVFHISISWGSFNGVWATASFLKSPGLSSLFWSLSMMQ